jgi:C4-dicarboxylate-binding protein DctP
VYYFFNDKWLEGLPADLQKIVLECADEAAAYQGQIDDEDQDTSLAAMVSQGVTVHNLPDAAAWVQACSPMLEEYRGKGTNWNSFIDKMIVIE